MNNISFKKIFLRCVIDQNRLTFQYECKVFEILIVENRTKMAICKKRRKANMYNFDMQFLH